MSHDAIAPPALRCQLCGNVGATYHPAGAAAGLELACELCWRWAGSVDGAVAVLPPVDEQRAGHGAAPMSTAAAIALWALWATGLVVVTALAYLAGVATRG